MKKKLLFVVILVSVLLSALYFLHPVFSGCNVSIVSKSKLISVKIVNKKLFKAFVYDLVPCKKGNFVVGEPFEQKGPYVVRSIQIVFDDIVYANATFPNRTEASKDDGKALFYFDFRFDKNKTIIYINLDKDFVKNDSFEKLFPFLLASKFDSIYKYNRKIDRISREYESLKNKYLLESIGLKINVK